MSLFELNELPEHTQALISNFISLNTGTYGENKEYYRGGYELIMYAMPNEEYMDKEQNINYILKKHLPAEDYIEIGPYA